jgi:hypothetical protein
MEELAKKIRSADALRAGATYFTYLYIEAVGAK